MSISLFGQVHRIGNLCKWGKSSSSSTPAPQIITTKSKRGKKTIRVFEHENKRCLNTFAHANESARKFVCAFFSFFLHYDYFAAHVFTSNNLFSLTNGNRTKLITSTAAVCVSSSYDHEMGRKIMKYTYIISSHWFESRISSTKRKTRERGRKRRKKVKSRIWPPHSFPSLVIFSHIIFNFVTFLHHRSFSVCWTHLLTPRLVFPSFRLISFQLIFV